MSFFKSMFGNRTQPAEASKPSNGSQSVDPAINKGVYYLYLIIGIQIAVVFGIVAVIMFVGQVIATPAWVFLAAFLLGIGGFVYIYRKAKRQFNKFRETLKHMHMSDRNYEISFMGGMLTMRVEQNPQRLLEAPAKPPLLEAETIDTTTVAR